MNADTEQHICTSLPFCFCTGKVNEWDECCCISTAEDHRCDCCGAPLVVINFKTGETQHA